MHTISDFEEKRGIFLVLQIIGEEGPINLISIRRNPMNVKGLGTNAIRHAVEKLLEMKLVKSVPSSKFSERKMDLTEKGKELMPLIEEFNVILSS